MSDTGRRWTGRVLIALLSVASGGAGRVAAQDDVTTLTERCGRSNPELGVLCREGALAVQAGMGGMGLLASGGAQIPGAASTLGRRFGGTPRFSLGLRGQTARIGTPDLEDGTVAGGDASFAFSPQVELAVGLLDGFSLLPTVGGILSLDVFGTAGLLLLPDAFEESGTAWGVGASVGVLRESFTLPGVTLSLAYRSLEEVQMGNRGEGDAIQVTIDPSVTSFRGVVGKDLLSFGVLAGVGWDSYSGDGAFAVSPTSLSVTGFDTDRWLYFGSVSMNLLLLQLSAEGGWATGFESISGRSNAGYEPDDGSLFLSLAARLTL